MRPGSKPRESPMVPDVAALVEYPVPLLCKPTLMQHGGACFSVVSSMFRPGTRVMPWPWLHFRPTPHAPEAIATTGFVGCSIPKVHKMSTCTGGGSVQAQIPTPMASS